MGNDNIHKSEKRIEWILYPVYGSKTRNRIQQDSRLSHFTSSGASFSSEASSV